VADTIALCRDCLARFPGDAARCPVCGGPRLVRHAELDALSIAHVDCDAFYASVEKRDNPAIADKPVIVGGGSRGVVAAACYVARTFGVHSAMPIFKALKACPHAIVIPPDMQKYARVGREVRDIMLALTPAVEPLSIDEAFLDLSGTERVHGATPAVTLARFQRKVETEIGVTVSVGLSHNKFLAKIASDLDKPRGFAAIGRAETLAFLADRPVSIIWGVGKSMQERLARDGVTTIAHLRNSDEGTLTRRYGSMGLRLARLSRGEDFRAVSPERKTKSISAETTFERDIGAEADLLPPLRELSEKVSLRLKRQELAGRLVVLKLKRDDFRLITRNVGLDGYTNLADRIFRSGRDLLRKALNGEKYRLIGIGVGDLGDAQLVDPANLVDASAEKRARAERAMDSIRERFGRKGLALGLTFTASPHDASLRDSDNPDPPAAQSPPASRTGRNRRNP
jgi:DNA polymerase-4